MQPPSRTDPQPPVKSTVAPSQRQPTQLAQSFAATNVVPRTAPGRDSVLIRLTPRRLHFSVTKTPCLTPTEWHPEESLIDVQPRTAKEQKVARYRSALPSPSTDRAR